MLRVSLSFALVTIAVASCECAPENGRVRLAGSGRDLALEVELE